MPEVDTRLLLSTKIRELNLCSDEINPSLPTKELESDIVGYMKLQTLTYYVTPWWRISLSCGTRRSITEFTMIVILSHSLPDHFIPQLKYLFLCISCNITNSYNFGGQNTVHSVEINQHFVSIFRAKESQGKNNHETTCSSEMTADFQRTAQRYIPQDRSLHKRCCENLKSYRQ